MPGRDGRVQMVKKIREVQLGAPAVDYIASCLANGKSLARLLAKTINLGAGRVVTYLPDWVSEERAAAFNSGFFAGGPGKEFAFAGGIIRPDLSAIIREFLAHGDAQLCIFEDQLAEPSYPFVARRNLPTFIHGDEVYLALAGGDQEDVSRVRATIHAARSWLFIGAMVSGVPFSELKNPLTDGDLLRLAEHTERLIIGAYDGEGFLIWTK